MAEQRLCGKLVSSHIARNGRRDYGFIAVPGSADVFVHKEDCPSGVLPPTDSLLEFEIAKVDGRLKAVRIFLIH